MSRPRGRRMALLAVLGALLLANLTILPVRALGFLFVVDTKGDGIDVNLIDNVCETSEGTCSLRAAIMQANAVSPGTGSHEIRLHGSVYMDIANTGLGENAAAEGDYDILRNTRIVGSGEAEIVAGATVGDGLDRIFDVRGANIDVSISGVALRYGDANGSNGGAIRAIDSGQTVTLDDVLIEKSHSSDAGVAIWSRADLTITDSVIRNNEGRNGTIYTLGAATVTIRRSTISGNTTTFNGSALYVQGDSDATVERSTISGNTSGTGGPIVVGSSAGDDSSLLLRNSTVANNTATIANGAMVASFADSVVTIESSTIGSNTGFGLDLDGPSSIKNTILAGNSRTSCAQEVTSAGHNLDAGTTCGFDGPGDLSPGSAQFEPLGDNGGPTKTKALKLVSDAIDAGADCPKIDQRGNSRPKDGDGDGVAVCDIGAYEHGAVAVIPTPTPEVTEAPTAPPTAAPTVEPTPGDTGAASLAPGESPAVSAGASLAPGETAVPGASAGGVVPSPAPSGEPSPADLGNFLGSNLWLVLAGILLLLILLLFFTLRRRRPEQRPGG